MSGGGGLVGEERGGGEEHHSSLPVWPKLPICIAGEEDGGTSEGVGGGEGAVAFPVFGKRIFSQVIEQRIYFHLRRIVV